MQTEALTVLDKDQPLAAPTPDLPAAIVESPIRVITTPEQARTDAISNVLYKAYERASTLELTDDEIAKLTKDFPDDAVTTGAGGDQHLLYIQHAYIRERLSSVFRPGQWTLINRRKWFDAETNHVYADCVLMIRGCFVGEAIGAQAYIPTNKRLNFSDAVEGAQSEALRRCAGKYLDCGLQVWKKSWCEAWFARQKRGARQSDAEIVEHEETRETEAKKRQYDLKQPAPATGDWRDVVVHFGKNKNVRLEDLEPQQLRWYQLDWAPRPFRGRISDKDQALRNALDASMGKQSADTAKPAFVAPTDADDEIPF